MVARPAHTAGTALRLGISSLSRDQVELLLGLVETETDALLVEQPQIATDGRVDEPQLVELTAELANTKADLTVGLAEIVDSLGESLVSLLECLADVGEARVHVPAHILDSLQQQLMSLRVLRLNATQLLANGGVRVPQLFQRGIDVNDRTARVVDQVEEVAEIRAQLVDARRDGGAFLNDLGDTTAGILIDDLDAVLSAHDVAAQLVRFFTRAVDHIANLMDEDRGTIDVSGQVLNLRLQLFVALAVLSGIVRFEPRGLDELHHMGL